MHRSLPRSTRTCQIMTHLALTFKSWSLQLHADFLLSVPRGGRVPFQLQATCYVTTTLTCSPFLSWAPAQKCSPLSLCSQEVACMRLVLEAQLQSTWNNSNRKATCGGT